MAVEEVNRFMKNPTLYGTIICRTSVKKGGYVINLNECRKVTVIVIPNAAGTFTVETSLDGETWEASFCGEVESDTREVELESYSAGAPVCGKELEFIRIWCEEDVPETIIYGF